MPNNNPVMEAIQAAFKIEVANQFTTTSNSIIVTLSNKEHVRIEALPIPVVQHRETDQQNYCTVQQHSYHYNQMPQPHSVVLQNIEDCRSYLDDVCHTLINATFHDFEVTIPDGRTYLITITAI